MKKISIIVPVYNTSKYLRKCLNSLLNQSITDIEIIVINDGSSDNSEEIIKEYKDKRIKYITKKNEGIGKTRNLGIKKAIGEYIGFIDSDDYVANDYCKIMYEKAIKDDCDIVVSNFYYDKGNDNFGKFIIAPFANTNLSESPELIYNLNLGPCNKIYKRDLLLNNNIFFEENLKYEDVTFVCKSLKYAKKIGKVDDYLSYYVIHENSQTTIRDEKVFDIFKVCDEIKLIFTNDKELQFYVNKAIIRIIADYMTQQRYQKEKCVAIKFINQAYKYLYLLDKDWKKNEMFQEIKKTTAFAIRHKYLLQLYCILYR